MRGYSTNGSNASGSANKTLITVIASTTVRPAIFDLLLGNSQTPADQAAKYALQRFTAAGTAGNSPTPEPLDTGDVAAIATTGNAHSVEPTYTAGKILWQLSLNQRASFRHVCNPGYEFKAPATAANGLGLYLVASTTALVEDGQIYWLE
jgi:hypothetical protein